MILKHLVPGLMLDLLIVKFIMPHNDQCWVTAKPMVPKNIYTYQKSRDWKTFVCNCSLAFNTSKRVSWTFGFRNKVIESWISSHSKPPNQKPLKGKNRVSRTILLELPSGLLTDSVIKYQLKNNGICGCL